MNEPNASSRQLRVFLCHSSGDKIRVRELYYRLKKDGFAPWFDEEDLIAGQDWQEVIPQAVRASDVVLVCLSRSSVTKDGFVQKEIKFALDSADEKPPGTIFIIPTLLEEVETPERLKRWQWVNLSEGSGYEKLLRALTLRAQSLGIQGLSDPHVVSSKNQHARPFGSKPSAPTVYLTQIKIIKAHSSMVSSIAISSDGRRAVSASADSTLKLWDLDSGQELGVLSQYKALTDAVFYAVLSIWDGNPLALNSVAITPDGKWAISASKNKTLEVWDLENRRALRTIHGHSETVNGVAVTLDGQRVVSASNDKTLKVWDLANGELLHTLQGHRNKVSGVAITPDGQRAISASWDTTLKVWDLKSGQELRTLKGHSNSDIVNGVAVMPGGRQAVSASWDRTLKVWNLESGENIRTFHGHSGSVTSVAISPDGRQAVSTSWDNTLKVWDMESGQILATYAGRSKCCAFLGNTRVVCGDYRGNICIYKIEEWN